MKFLSVFGGALVLATSATAQDNSTAETAETAETASLSSSSTAFKWVTKYWQGSNYLCKCAPGDWCWPNSLQWRLLNASVGGNLRVNIPIGAPCHNNFQGPLGNVNTYNAAQCANISANFGDEQFQ